MTRRVWLVIVFALIAGAGCKGESKQPPSAKPPATVEKFVWEVGTGEGSTLRCVRDQDGERCRVIRASSAFPQPLSSSTAVEAVRSSLRGDPRGALRSVHCLLRKHSERVLCDVDFATTCDVLVVTRRGADLVVKHPAHALCIHAVL